MEPLAIALGLLLIAAAATIGFVAGRRSPARRPSSDEVALRRLEEYEFYPFSVNADGLVEFAPDAFDRAVQHFLVDRNPRAAGELIVIGEQNLVRDTFPSEAWPGESDTLLRSSR